MLARATVTHFAPARGARPAALVRTACGVLLPAAAHCADPSCPVCRQVIGAGPRFLPATRDAGDLMCPRCQEWRLLERDDAGGVVCAVCAHAWIVFPGVRP